MEDKTLQTLDYHKILERLAALCAFEPSKRLALALRPSDDLEEAHYLQSLTREAFALLAEHPAFSIGGARHIEDSLDLAGRGGLLEPVDFLDIQSTLVAARNLQRALEREKELCPHLAELGERIPQPPGLIETISNAISDRGEILDSASPRLSAIRSELRVVHNRLLSRLQRMISNPETAGLMQEALVTLRDGRYVLPLRAEFKGRIKGIVHDQSSSGATLFIEPLAIVEQNNQYRQLQLDERDEEQRILADLSRLVGDFKEEIQHAVDLVAQIDLSLAKARLAEEMDAVEPELLLLKPRRSKSPQDEPQPHPGTVMRLYQARHPLLDAKTVVPVDVVLPEDAFAMVITGPNTGGKTVTLKTIGLLCLMAQSGLHIPAQKGSSLSLFQGIFADIGDEQSIEQSLSTFSGHINNIIHILGAANESSLVILDELGAGTDPQEGAALARALLGHLLQRGITTLVTTHHPELKTFAHTTRGVVNASVEFDLKTLRPTYHLTVGLPGRSNALAIARRLGLDEKILKAARKEVAPEDLHADRLLEDIRHQRELTRQARLAAERAQKEVETLRVELAARLENIEAERRELLAEAHLEALQELEALRAEIGELRAELLRRRGDLAAVQPLIQEVERLEKSVASPPQRADLAEEVRLPEEFNIGDRVRLRNMRTTGVISSIEGDAVEVLVGNLRVRTALRDLEPAGSSIQGQGAGEPLESASTTAATSGGVYRQPSPGMELDLRGRRAEDALQALERYLESAYLAGLPFVRIIHGKGSGKLRQVVREALSAHPQVLGFETGKPSEGGDGVTVAKLDSG